MKRWGLIMVLMVASVGIAEGKKKPAPPKEPPAPRRNFIDLRSAKWFCNEQACALDVSQLGLIGCSVNGCASVTDVIVSTGPVERAQVPPPTK